ELEDLSNQPNIKKLSDTDDSSSVSEDENILSAALVTLILNSRIKSLRFATNTQQTNTRIKLQDDDFFAKVFNLEESNNNTIEFEENK
ncbi:669_t:CDS:2, partial [Racocetra persica]